MKAGDGTTVRVVGTLQDVTDRRAAEAGREQLASIVDSSHDAIIGKTLDGIIVSWNKGAEQLYGYCSEEVIGKPKSILLPPDRSDELAANLARLGRGERIEHEETVRRRKDGTLVDVSLIISPVKNALGHVTGASAIARDITDKRRAEHALKEAEAQLAHISRVATMGELASSIAHEVNQPLAAIVNDGAACLRWLHCRPPALDEARESVQHMIGDANRASHVIARIRALLARKRSAKSPFDPNDLVRDTVALVNGEIARADVTLRCDLASGLPPVLGDRVQVQQVLLNLLMNALEAISRVNGRPRDLTVTSARGASSTVVIAARDSGEGIPREVRDRIFEPFYTTKPEGLGMGLAISRSIIEEHGGQLWVLDDDGGPGTTVQFTVPVADEA
jgi:PAS domain S-box-containing protein